jgi:hypothetical protein
MVPVTLAAQAVQPYRWICSSGRVRVPLLPVAVRKAKSKKRKNEADWLLLTLFRKKDVTRDEGVAKLP